MSTSQVVYVAIAGEYPFAAGGHLGDVQAAAVARESEYDREPREYRWDEYGGRGDEWQLMVFNARTNRWNKCHRRVCAVPIVDAPSPA